jgi:hypothetical protein
MNRTSARRTSTAIDRLSFEPMEHRQMLAGDGLGEGGAVDVFPKDTSIVFEWGGSLPVSVRNRMEAHKDTVSSATRLSSIIAGASQSPSGPAELSVSLEAIGSLGRNSIIGSSVTAAEVALGPLPDSRSGSQLTQSSIDPADKGEGGPVSVAQSLRPPAIDLAVAGSWAALAHSAGIEPRRPSATKVMGEMARSLVVEQVARVGVRATGASREVVARPPTANTPLLLVSESSRTAGHGVDATAAVRRGATTHAAVAGHRAVGLHRGDHVAIMRWHAVGLDVVRSVDVAVPLQSVVDHTPDVDGDAAEDGPQGSGADAWRRLLTAAPVVVLVLIQKLVDEALLNGSRQSDDLTVAHECSQRPAVSQPRRIRRRPRSESVWMSGLLSRCRWRSLS